MYFEKNPETPIYLNLLPFKLVKIQLLAVPKQFKKKNEFLQVYQR